MATQPNFVNFFAPDAQVQQQEIARQQAMADMLRQQAITPIQTQTVSGSGMGQNRVVPISPFEGIAQLGRAYFANKMQGDIDQKQTEYNMKIADALKRALAGDTGGTGGASGGSDGSGGLGTAIGGSSGGPGGFSIANLMRGQAIGQIGGDGAASAYWDGLKTPEAIKVNNALGISPQDARLLEMSKRGKEGTQTFQPGQTNILPSGATVVAPDFTNNIAGGFDAQGNPVARGIPGVPEALGAKAGAVAGATKAAELPFASPTTVDTQSGPRLMTPAQQIAAANGSNLRGNFSGPAEDVIKNINDTIKDPQERANALVAYANQLTGKNPPGMPLMSPEDKAVNSEKGTAAIAAAKTAAAAEPLLQVINQARQINSSVPYGPYGMADARALASGIPGMDHTSATNAALWKQMMGQSILNTISSVASSGGVRMDIPIVKEIEKAGGIDMSLPPETRARMLDQLESEIKSRVSAAGNLVPALNKPNLTSNTQTTPMSGTPVAPINSQGWKLHTDAKGNQAYVSPDGKNYQEVK